jgi:hypothetical protein
LRSLASGGVALGCKEMAIQKVREWVAHAAPKAVALLLGGALLHACVLYDYNAFAKAASKAVLVKSDAEQFTLSWDPSSGDVAGYKVYFRIHGSTEWVLLGNVPAGSEPEMVVLHSTLGDGEYDFAVAAVDSSGHASSLASSLDTTADPSTGWYLQWQLK